LLTKHIVLILVFAVAVTVGIGGAMSLPHAQVEAELTNAIITEQLAGFQNEQQMVRTELITQTSQIPTSVLKEVTFDSGFALLNGNIFNDTNNSIQSGKNMELGVIRAEPMCVYVVLVDGVEIPLIDAVISNMFTFELQENPYCQPDSIAYDLYGWRIIGDSDNGFTTIDELGGYLNEITK